MKSVLLVGATGLLGNSLKALLSRSCKVEAVSRQTGFDIRSPSAFRSLKTEYDAIVNCAARIDCTSNNLLDSFQTNVQGAINCAYFAEECNAHLIHISTLSAYEEPENQIRGYYGISKCTADQVLLTYSMEASLAVSICRFPALYDTTGRARDTQPMLYRMIDQVLSSGEVLLYGSIDPMRNYLHVDDAAILVSELLEHKKTGILNCAHPESLNIQAISEAIGRVINISPHIKWLKEKPDLKTIFIPVECNVFEGENMHQPRPLECGIKEIIEFGKP